MNNTLWLNIEISPGSDIKNASEDAIALATKLGVTVWFRFNEIHCGACPNGNPDLLVRNFHKAIERKSQFKIAMSH